MKLTLRKTPYGLQVVAEDALLWFQHLPLNSEIEVDYKSESRRTNQQNRSLHLLMQQLAETLNNAGLDMKKTLKHDAEIPWSPDRVKEFIWRPLQIAILGIESTTEANTTDYTKVYDVLAHHMATKHGITIPAWPDRFTQAEEAA